MNHARLPIRKSQLDVLVHVYILSGVDLLDGVPALGDDHDPLSAGFVDYHAADFGVGTFAAAGCFGGFEEEVWTVGYLWWVRLFQGLEGEGVLPFVELCL